MALLIVAANTVAAVAAIILLVRLNGLRSFSKMSSFDFALTVAAASILATMMTTTKSPAPELLAFLALFLSRYAISLTRQCFRGAERLTDTPPLLLMYEGVLHGETLDDDLLKGVSWGKETAPG